MTVPRGPVDRRIRVFVVRRRLEESAADLVARATGERPDQHSAVRRRLLLLAAGVPAERWNEVYGLARRAGTVYGQTSEMLHSNRAFGDVPEYLVREWEQVAVDVVRTVAEGGVGLSSS